MSLLSHYGSKIFGPVFSFSQPVISQLGALAKEMTEEELSSLHLVERRSIAALGAVQGWSQKQVTVLQDMKKQIIYLTFV